MRNKALIFVVSCLLWAGIFFGCQSGPLQTPAEPEPAAAPAGRPETPPVEEPIDPGKNPALENPAEEPDYAEMRPHSLNRDEFTAAFSEAEVELDFRKSFVASEAQIFTGLYEGLFSYHPFTMEPVPGVVSRWETSEDKKQWTFTLRNDAQYWNGDPVTAGDFRAAWLSLLENENSPYSSLFDIIEGARDYRLGILKDPNRVGISVSGDRTLVVRLNAPAAFFPSMLCHHSFSPIHPSMLNNQDWSQASPVSNGPFYVSELNRERMVLVKNEHYWDVRRVALNKITIAFTSDGDEASALWNSGEVRWIAGDFNFDTLTDRSGVSVSAMFATHYYFIRSTKPWDDYRIRQALLMVLPWDEIRGAHMVPAKTLIYPIPGYPQIEGVDSGDVEEARGLLAKAGYPGGVGLPELVIRITPSPDAERISGLMAAAWFEKLGVPVKIQVVPFSQYLQSLRTEDYQVGFSTWIGDFADPYTFLQMWRKDSNLNDAWHHDDEFETLMERSMTEEGQKRWKTLAEAEELLLSRGSVLPISYQVAVNIIDTDEIDGWYPNVLDIHPFKYISFKNFRPLPGVAQVSASMVN